MSIIFLIWKLRNYVEILSILDLIRIRYFTWQIQIKMNVSTTLQSLHRPFKIRTDLLCDCCRPWTCSQWTGGGGRTSPSPPTRSPGTWTGSRTARSFYLKQIHRGQLRSSLERRQLRFNKENRVTLFCRKLFAIQIRVMWGKSEEEKIWAFF